MRAARETVGTRASTAGRRELITPVGRSEEIGALRRVIEIGASGRPTVALVLGASGIGKTTLIEEVLRLDADAWRAAVVLRATGDEAEVGLEFGVVDQLVRAAPLAATGRDRFTVPPRTAPLDAGAMLLRAFDDLALDVPLVMVIDDAHLADDASLQALTFAARRLQDDAVTIVLLGRPELVDRLPVGLGRLAQTTGGVVELGGLDRDAVGELAARVLGRPVSAAAAERLRSHTDGHPLHTRVLLSLIHI